MATKLIADPAQAGSGRAVATHARRRTLLDEALNVFRIHGTAMRPNLLLMVKLVTLAFLFSGQIVLLSHHFVPFVGLFRHVGSPSAFHLGLELIFLAGAASLLLNHQVRIACIVLGGVVLISIASSMKYYENNREYTALILILAGLEDPRGNAWLLRGQLILLYSAAALNKVLLADWRDGHFFNTWLNYLHHSAWAKISGVLPDRVLAALISWAAIVTEIALAIGLALRRYLPVVIWVGVAYHTTLVLVMNRTFGMFWVAAGSTYLAFISWPKRPLLVEYGANLGRLAAVARLLRRIDFEDAFRWQRSDAPGLAFALHGVTYRGWRAVLWILLCNPVSYMVFVALAVLPQPQPRLAALVAFAILGAVAVSAVGERLSAMRRVPAPATGPAGA
jgi:hypothetical protein